MAYDSAFNSTNPNQEEEEEEEEEEEVLTALLPSVNDSSAYSKSTNKHIITTIFFLSILHITCVTVSNATSLKKISRPLVALTEYKKPVVIMISSDGFKFGYQFKTPTPNINRLIVNGTEAETGLIPVFPTLTFPNHYSIVTGLYPPYHGIINNYFMNPHNSSHWFTTRSHDPKWWLGEPLWETVVNHGLKAATYFWAGSEVRKGSWNCPPKYCMAYNSSVPFEDRVDKLLSYFDLPDDEIPALMALYLEEPDKQGHMVGPDAPEIRQAVAKVDSTIGRLIKGLESRNLFEDVNIILVRDHGMLGTCDRTIFLEDLASWIQIPEEWVHFHTPLLVIRPPDVRGIASLLSEWVRNQSQRIEFRSAASGLGLGALPLSNTSSLLPGCANPTSTHEATPLPDVVNPSDVVRKMNEGLQSGKVENGKFLKVFLKEELPSRLHYAESERIPPIIGMIEEGFTVKQSRTRKGEDINCAGSHGYDNAFFSMRSIFIGHGPRFARGRKVASSENVQIYNLVTSILKIKGAANNGSESFPEHVLLPKEHVLLPK